MMKRATACQYVELSAAELEREIAAGRLPHPVMLGNVVHWSRAEIDAYLERLTENEAAATDWRSGTKLYANG
ncbi:helix-turn-helix transcriptional regulator [Sphingobium abikonense]